MFGLNFLKKTQLPSAADALPGRAQPIPTAETHFVNGAPLKAPFGAGVETVIFGLGCFWGAERKFWQVPGVVSTAVGYAAGLTPNPTYEEVCSGLTGHNEVVLVAYDPARVSFEDLLRVFFEAPAPPPGRRLGNEGGPKYRSGISVTRAAQREAAERAKLAYGEALRQAGHREAITTEILDAPDFYYAETYHQQYLAKNPRGYCGLGGTGVSCPVGLGAVAAE